MKQTIYYLIIILLASVVLTSCSSDSGDIAGTGSSVGNAKIAGVVVTEGKEGVLPNTPVYLIPSNYSVKSATKFAKFIDTTDEFGTFSFDTLLQTKFTIQVKGDTAGYIQQNISPDDLGLDSLSCEVKPYGAIEVLAQKSFDMTDAYVGIRGTTIAMKVDSVDTIATGLSLVIDGVPTAEYEGLYLFRDTVDTIDIITDSFIVTSNDTIAVSVTDYEVAKIYTSINSGLPNDSVYSVSVNGDGSLWFGTRKGVIGVYKDSIWGYIDLKAYEIYSSVLAVAFDSDGTLWCGTHWGALYFGKEKLIRYDFSKLPTNISGSTSVRDIQEDGDGYIWFAIQDGGIARLDKKGKWRMFHPNNSRFPSMKVNSLTVDNDGDIWATTPSGIAHFDDNEWVIYNTTNSGVICNNVTAMTIEGEVKWFAGRDGSIMKLDDDGWEVYRPSDSPLANEPIYTLLVDDDGVLWAANQDTTGNTFIAAFNGSKWATFHADNSFISPKSGRVFGMVLDDNGSLWMATEFCGVVEFRKDLFF